MPQFWNVVLVELKSNGPKVQYMIKYIWIQLQLLIQALWHDPQREELWPALQQQLVPITSLS